MDLKIKSKEELINQIEGFLKFSQFSEKEKNELIKALGLSETDKKGFFNWFVKFCSKEVDISDKKEIEKRLKKKNIDFEKLWDSYQIYLKEKSIEKHPQAKRKRVESFFEPYKTENTLLNERLVNAINNVYSKENMGKVKVFMSSPVYKESYKKGQTKNTAFLEYFLENVKSNEDLQFLLDKVSIDDLQIFFSNRILLSKSFIEIVKLAVNEFNIKSLVQTLNLNVRLVKGPLGDNKNFWYSSDVANNLNILQKNVDTLKEHGYNLKQITNINKLLLKDISFYIEKVNDVVSFLSDYRAEAENDVYKGFADIKNKTKEELLSTYIKYDESKINEFLLIPPKRSNEIGFDISGVLMDKEHFGRITKSTEKTIHYIFSCDTDWKVLSAMRTVKWLKNWKQNINLAYDEHFISSKHISNNEYILGLKCIPHGMLKQLVNRSLNGILKLGLNKNLFELSLGLIIGTNNAHGLLDKGLNKDNFKKIMGLVADRNNTYILIKNLEIVLKKWPKIKIDNLVELKGILVDSHPQNLEITLDKFPNIKISSLRKLEYVLNDSNPETLKLVLEKYQEIIIGDLVKLKDVLCGSKPVNLEIILNKFPEITTNDLVKLEDIFRYSKLETLSFWLNYIPTLKKVQDYKSVLYLYVPDTFWRKLQFKENDHAGYLQYINAIAKTEYKSFKKQKMIEKIVSLPFNEVANYLEVFQMLDDSISMDVQRVKNELIDQILEADNPREVAGKILNIFEKCRL